MPLDRNPLVCASGTIGLAFWHTVEKALCQLLGDCRTTLSAQHGRPSWVGDTDMRQSLGGCLWNILACVLAHGQKTLCHFFGHHDRTSFWMPLARVHFGVAYLTEGYILLRDGMLGTPRHAPPPHTPACLTLA